MTITIGPPFLFVYVLKLFGLMRMYAFDSDMS